MISLLRRPWMVASTLGFLVVFPMLGEAEAQALPSLVARLKEPGQAAAQPLKAWTQDELRSLKRHSSREKDPSTGQVVKWEGILLSEVVEQALKGLSARTKAEIDLIQLRNGAGEKALIPRAFVVKYPILLAFNRENHSLGQKGPYSVIPWTSKSKVLTEGAPLERFFLPGVAELEFLNSQELYSSYRLKRRTDPAAMKGEKIFLRTCVSCHATGLGPNMVQVTQVQASQKLVGQGHPSVAGAPKLEGPELRFLSTYLTAFGAQ